MGVIPFCAYLSWSPQLQFWPDFTPKCEDTSMPTRKKVYYSAWTISLVLIQVCWSSNFSYLGMSGAKSCMRCWVLLVLIWMQWYSEIASFLALLFGVLAVRLFCILPGLGKANKEKKKFSDKHLHCLPLNIYLCVPHLLLKVLFSF